MRVPGRSGGGGGCLRGRPFPLVWALAAAATLLPAVPALAEVGRYASYRGPDYAPGATHLTPTAAKPQNKVWWRDGRWWTLLVADDDRQLRVASLAADHTWSPSTTGVVRAVYGTGDVLARGAETFVLVRTEAGLLALSLRYDPAQAAYRLQRNRTAIVAPRGSNTAALALDAEGRLWAAYIRADRVWVAHSDPGRRRWVPAYPVPRQGGRLSPGEIVDMVAFDDRVGVFWSDQRRGEFRFASRAAAGPERSWTTEIVARGPGIADDHVSTAVLWRPEGDVVLAAVKTSLGDAGEADSSPLVVVLRREDAGTWSPHTVATVGDNWTRPVLALDAAGTAYVVGRRAGSIVAKAAPASTLDFAPGPGTVLMSSSGASLTDPTVPGQVVDQVCGLLVLASDTARRAYWHGEVALDLPARLAGSACRPAESAAPISVDATVNERLVRLSWAEDGAVWTPAGERVARRFAVHRGGRRIGVTTGTTFVDQPARAGRYVYRVSPVPAGRGAAVGTETVRVERVATTAVPAYLRDLALLAGAGLVLTAGAGAAVRVRRRRRWQEQDLFRARLASTVRTVPAVPQPRGRHARAGLAGAARMSPGAGGRVAAAPVAASRTPGRHRKSC